MTRKQLGLARATLVICVQVLLPSPAAAQFGALEALARKVTDISFYFNGGDVFSGGQELKTEGGLRQFGVELLFSVGSVDRATGPAPAPADTASLVWTEMLVVRSDGTADTTYTYEVRPASRLPPPMETTWYFEMGFGYGQMSGFESTNPAFDLRGQIRDLPAVSLYASYEPWGAYVGLRTGFQKLQSVQLFDDNGVVFKGKAETFFSGALTGYAVEFAGINFFVEAAVSLRDFVSVEWSPPFGTPLRADLPRHFSLSGWTFGAGIQYGLGN